MPLGDPQAYIDQGMPPEQALAAAFPQGPPPPGAMPPGAAPMGPPPAAGDEDAMLAQLINAVLGKWSSDAQQIAGEKSALMEVLMQLAGAPAPMGMPGTPEETMGPEPELGMESLPPETD